ncbi:MAG: hypothetical protein U0174_01820 [Polyangiaceae bacterium]
MSKDTYEQRLARGYPYLRALSPSLSEGAAEAARAYVDGGFHERIVPTNVALLALDLPEVPNDAALEAYVMRSLGAPRIEGPRFLLEALVGTDPLATAVVKALIAASEMQRELPTLEGEFRALGMMLRRVSPHLRHALSDDIERAAILLGSAATRAYRIITGGFAAVAELGQRDAQGELTAYDLVFADDDPTGVARALERMRIDENVRPNVRLAYLGGDRGLRCICDRVLEFSPRFWHLFHEDFGPLENADVKAACARLHEAKAR